MIGVIGITYSDIQKRIKKRRRRFKIFLFMIILSLLALFILTTPVFKVNDIIVNGNNIVPTDKIISLSGVSQGDNILRLNMGQITENVLANPYVESCSINLSLLGSVYINVTERENSGIAPFQDKYVTIDKNGAVIEVLDGMEGLNLPLISGLNIKSAVPGRTIELVDSRQLDTVKAIFDGLTESGLSDAVNEADIGNMISIVLKTKYDVIIKLGTIDNIENKLITAKAIIEQDISKKGMKGTLDMSFNGNPVFRQE